MSVSIRIAKDKGDRSKDYLVSEEEANRLIAEKKIVWDAEVGVFVEVPNWSMT